MDALEYLGRAGDFAIMRRGAPSGKGAGKELERLLDLRPGTAGYESRQLVPFLESCGRHFEWSGPLTISGKGEDEERLSELGYYIFRNAETGRSYLNHEEDSWGRHGTYIVAIRSGEHPVASLMGRREALLYVAELGLVAQGYGSKAIRFRSTLNETGSRATYTLSPPPSLWLDLEDAQDERGRYRWAALEGTLGIGAAHGMPESFGILKEHRGGGEVRWTLAIDLRKGSRWRESGILEALHPGRSAAQGEAPDERALGMLAAGQLLALIAERDHLKPRRFAVDPATLQLKRSDAPDLMGELIGAIASGKVHPCAHCGRPLMGGTWYCRGRRCHVTDLEKCRRMAAAGRGAADIRAAYPHIKPATIESYIQDARTEAENEGYQRGDNHPIA